MLFGGAEKRKMRIGKKANSSRSAIRIRHMVLLLRLLLAQSPLPRYLGHAVRDVT